jgi:hypothetical protein
MQRLIRDIDANMYDAQRLGWLISRTGAVGNF